MPARCICIGGGLTQLLAVCSCLHLGADTWGAKFRVERLAAGSSRQQRGCAKGVIPTVQPGGCWGTLQLLCLPAALLTQRRHCSALKVCATGPSCLGALNAGRQRCRMAAGGCISRPLQHRLAGGRFLCATQCRALHAVCTRLVPGVPPSAASQEMHMLMQWLACTLTVWQLPLEP